MSFWQTVLHAAASLDERSYYELLGVPSDASGDLIMARFYELTAKLHPDRHARERDAARRDALTRIYARLNEGVRVLSVPAQRDAYDQGLREGKVRVDPEDKPSSGPRETRDPKTEAGRKLLDKALAMLRDNDRRGARAQLQLAKQMEPDSHAIARAVDELDELERRRKQGLKPKPQAASSPTASPAPAASSPAPASASSTPAPAPAAAARPAPVAARPAPVAAPASQPAAPASQPAAPASQPAAPTLATAAPAAQPAAAPPSATAPARAPAGRRQRRSSGPKLARAHTRYPSAVPVRLRIAGWKRFETLVAKDISRGGMFLRTDRPLATGQPVALTFALPDGSSLELTAEVARSVHPAPGVTAGMGLRFAEMPTSVQVQLRELVKTHAQQTRPAPADAAPVFEQLVAELARVQASGLHQIFGLGTDATLDDLNRAYRDRVTRFHPRHFAREEDSRGKEAALELMVCLREARDRLRDLLAAPDAVEEWRPEDTGVRLARQRHERSRRPSLRPNEPAIATRRLLDGELFDDNAVTDTEKLASRARQLIQRGDFGLARAELEAALSAAPREPRLLAGYFLAAGYAAQSAGDGDQAVRYFRQALAYDPHCAEAIIELRR